MQSIYTYIPETNYVPREYSVAAILLLLFIVLISLVSVLNLLHFYISTFRSMCAVPNMAVFWGSLTSCFPVILLTYFLSDFEIVPVAPIITGITFVFTFHMLLLLLLLLLHAWFSDCTYARKWEKQSDSASLIGPCQPNPVVLDTSLMADKDRVC